MTRPSVKIRHEHLLPTNATKCGTRVPTSATLGTQLWSLLCIVVSANCFCCFAPRPPCGFFGSREIQIFGSQEIQIFGTWKSRNLGSKHRKTNLKIKICSAQNVGKVWISRNKNPPGTIWGHLRPFFPWRGDISKMLITFAYFPWWANKACSHFKETRARGKI